MSSYLNQGAAVVLPNQTPSTYDVIQNLQRQNEIHRQRVEQDQKDEETRQNLLTKYLGENFDPSNFDGLLGQQITNNRAKYAKLIQQNPSMSMNDLATTMQGDLGKLYQWNNALKMGRDQIKGEADSYKQYKGFDTGGLQNAALRDYAYDKDGNLKTADQLGDPSGAVKKTLYNNPGLFLTKEFDPYEDLKNTEVAKDGQDYKYINSHKGMEDRHYTAEYYSPYQYLDKQNGKDPVLRTRGKALTMPDGSPIQDFEMGANGKPQQMVGLDDVAWQKFLAHPGRELMLRNELNKQFGGKFDPESPVGQALMRKMAYKQIDNSLTKSPKNFEIKRIVKDNPDIKISTNSDAFLDHPMKHIVGAVNGDPETDQLAEVDPETGLKNILPALGGKWNQPDVIGGGRAPLTKLLYDPLNRQKGVQAFWNDYLYNKDGTIAKDDLGRPKIDPKQKSKWYTPGELPAWLKRSANANIDRRNADKFINQMHIKPMIVEPKKPEEKKPKSTSAIGSVIDNMKQLLGFNQA